MTKKLNISPEDMIQTPVCKNPEEAISKETFLKGFELCVKQFKWLNQTYFSSIIKRTQTDLGIITTEEYSDLMKLLEDKDFLEMASQVFNKAILFSKTNEQIIWNINPETLKSQLILHVYKKVVKDNTQEILLEERWVSWLLSNGEDISIFSKHSWYFIKYLKTWEVKEFSNIIIKPELREIWLIWVTVIWKWIILLNEKWEQVSPQWEFYKKIDRGLIEKLWLILVEQDRNSWKFLDKTGKQVSPEWAYYEWFKLISLEGMYMLWVQVKWKWWIILDEHLRQISEENTYYEGLSLTEVWLIKAEIKWKWEVLLDKNGLQVTPKGEFYGNIHIHHCKDITLIEANVIWKWRIILDEKWTQISPEWKYFGWIDLHNLEKYWVIEVAIWEKNLLFDANWKQISPHEDRIYDWFDLWRFDEFWLIVGEIRLITRDIRRHGGILFDKTGKRISPQWEYFDSFDLNNFKEFWLIEWVSKENWRVLFDKDWKRISPQWEIYEFFNTSKLGRFWMIEACIKNKWVVLIDINWKQITQEWEYFDRFNFDNFEETWLIKVIKELKSLLLDKTWKIHFSCKKDENIFYDDKINKFYIEWVFWRRKYIEVNLGPNKL